MRRRVMLVGLALAMMTTGAVAQNTFPASGNVGIGTTGPVWELQVGSSAGNIGFQTDLTGGSYNNMTQPGDVGMFFNGSNPNGLVISPWASNASGLRITSSTISMFDNVGIGTTSPGATLEVNGNVKLTANSGASMTFQDGTTQTTAWTGVLCGGDYAESVKASGAKQSYEPGDVLVLTDDSKGEVQKSSQAYSTMVAGIYATRPGVIGRRQSLKNSPDTVPMAMVGIVPTKVTAENGAIHRGDLLVSSAVPGYAMKGTDRSRMLGAVIGKAMGSLDSGQGVIEVLVTLQ